MQPQNVKIANEQQRDYKRRCYIVNGAIVIVGCGRSGGTLLRRLLSTQPEVVSCGETMFYPEVEALVELTSRCAKPPSLSVEAISDTPGFSTWGLPPTLMKAVIRRGLAEGLVAPEILVMLWRSLTDHTEKRNFVLDKTPLGAEILELQKHVQTLKVVHIVRDPIAVAISHVRLGWYSDPEMALTNWHQRVSATMRNVSKLEAHKTFTVKYEDLVEDTAKTLNEICEFLDMRFSDQMLTDTEPMKSAMHTVRFSECHPRILGPISLPKISSKDIKKFETVIGPRARRLASEFGYHQTIHDQKTSIYKERQTIERWKSARQARRELRLASFRSKVAGQSFPILTNPVLKSQQPQ